MGPLGVFCGLYREDIVDASVASECGEYKEY